MGSLVPVSAASRPNAPRNWLDRVAQVQANVANPAEITMLNLRPGMDLVISDVPAGCDEAFVHEEPADMVGLGFHLNGGSRFAFERNRIETGALDCVIVATPKGAISRFHLPRTGFRTVALRFTPDAAEELIGCDCPAGADLIAMARAANDRVVVRHGARLDATSATSVRAMLDNGFTGSGGRLHLESCALGLLAAQINAGAEPGPTSDRRSASDRKCLLHARDYVDAHLDEPPSILELARVCGLNDFKLKRDFKRLFGTTVFGYVRERRMLLAADHLREGLSVQQAAADVGYACPSRFASAFHKRFGVRPGVMSRAS